MQVVITEADFDAALGGEETRSLRQTQKEAILGENPAAEHNAILEAFPKVLVDRVKKMIPPEFEVKQIQMNFAFSGAPFGVGVSGNAAVTFGPKADPGAQK